MVRAALDTGAVSPDQISYIEAHGTGTAVGDPAGLLRRRPDIRVAERQLAASTALVGVAIDRYPLLPLSAGGGIQVTGAPIMGCVGSPATPVCPGC